MQKFARIKKNNEEGGCDYTGVAITKKGKRSIMAWVGRDGNMYDYINCYLNGEKVRITATTRLDISEYKGTIDTDSGLYEIIAKPVYNKNRNIVEAYDLFLGEEIN